jgi:class 3 adenylate cyclase
MTKGSPHMVYLSDSTREMLTREDFELEHVDSVDIRGRARQVVIWTVGSQA